LAAGKAYRCYSTAAELEAMREEQKAKGLPQRYDGRWRDRTDRPRPGTEADPKGQIAAGKDDTDWPEAEPYVVRLKAPTDGETVIADKVQGTVRQANSELDDFVLLRSDGTPTYMLAVVVDDHDMGVTDVIRGDDHLTNTFRQLALIHALGWPEPVYAHVPMIHGPDGAKLSKRHGALGVEAYRDEMGILPEALENYLLRLGWAHGDTELIARPEAVQLFDLAGVGRSPGRFDLKKLESVNAHYLKLADNARLLALAEPRIAESIGRSLADSDRDVLLRSMDELKTRAKNLNELAASTLFLLRNRPLLMDEAAAKLLDPAGLAYLAEIRAVLAALPAFERGALEDAAKAVADGKGLGLGKIAGPLRASLSGQANSPSVFAVMAALGRDESLGRIDDALQVK
ncbi:MAG: glutamate--tRNA ligase, partial [Sandaracinobacteroides sp.]